MTQKNAVLSADGNVQRVNPEELAKLPYLRQREGMYLSNLIPSIIAARFFTGGERSDANIFPEYFKSDEGIPLELIAYTATLVSYIHV
jgi:hypothetical protein